VEDEQASTSSGAIGGDVTTQELVRCAGCGRHKGAEQFRKGAEHCRACVQRETPAQHARAAEPVASQGRKAPSRELAALVAQGRAQWHQCDGADAHPKHRAIHKRGFWSEGHRVQAFIEGHCSYPDGPLVGELVGITGSAPRADGTLPGMIPWQREATYEIFKLRKDGHRQHRRVLIGVAKKNSKTVWAGWIALYVLADDLQKTGQIVCAAASEDQADLVFGYAKICAELSPTLNELTGGQGRGSTRYEAEIQMPGLPLKSIKRLAVGGGKLDGRNIILAIEDEYHEWLQPRSRDTHTVLNRGTILQRDSIVLMFTTAGFDPESMEWELYEYGMQVEDGEVKDDTFLFIWYEAPQVCNGAYRGPYEGKRGEALDYRSREGFEAANPSAGLTVTYERYLEDIKDPKMSEGIARRYHMNQHTETEDIWLPAPWGAYQSAEPFRINPDDRTVAAIDASTNMDSTAITWWGISGEGTERFVRSRSRVWERPIDPGTGRPRDGWRMPYAELKAHLYSMHFGTGRSDEDEDWEEDGKCFCCGEAFEPMEFESIGYDVARLSSSIPEWEMDGLPLVEIAQSGKSMPLGFQEWYVLLREERFEHDGNPIVGQHILNSDIKFTTDGLRRLTRKTSSVRRPNDAAITHAMCGWLIAEEESGFSFYTPGSVQGDEDEDDE
jgi:phage terminase large subunit-like protein